MQNAALLKEDLAAVISTAVGRVFTNRGKATPTYYKTFLKELKSEHAYPSSLDMAYFGEVPIKKPGEPTDFDTIEFGEPRFTDALSHSLGFKITREALLKMQKKPYGDFSTSSMISVQKLGAAMRDSENHTKEAASAQVILQANSLTATDRYNPAGRYGKSLASVSHKILKQPGTVWANLFTGASLDQASLGAMITAALTIPSDEGFLRAASKKFRLIVGPKLMNRAYEIIHTNLLADTNHNNKSILSQFNIEIFVNPYLGATFNGYALQMEDHEMYHYSPVDAMLEDEEDWDTKGWRYSIYYQFGLDWHSPYGFLFNPGA
jgi:hypothetical protein